MSQEVFKTPKAKRSCGKRYSESWSPAKRRKIKDRFLKFCDIVLTYTRYESIRQEELRAKNNTSPLDSGGSTAGSLTSESAASSYADDEVLSRHDGRASVSPPQNTHSDEESYEGITCFCKKPFAKRPMIECSQCLTWIHLTCAKIRRNNIPDIFVCPKCQENKLLKRKSGRLSMDRRKKQNT